MEYKPYFADQLDKCYISHHGILGQHWGVRRYQNPDGSLTPEGRKRYAKSLAVVDFAKSGLKSLRDESALEYATNQNNYEVLKRGVEENEKEGWSREDQFRRYPYMESGINKTRRTAEYNKAQVQLIDAMSKKVSDIDVTKQSFEDTVKLVHDILDDGDISMRQLEKEYLNSPEYKEYKRMSKIAAQKSKQLIRDSNRQLLEEYKI